MIGHPVRLGFVLRLAGALALAGSAQAQAVVRGVVIDSLRGRPLPDAFVSVEHTGLVTRTDARGRFELRGVPTGSQHLVVRSPYLDSMALGTLRSPVEVARATHTVTLATPSLAAYQRAVCGAELPETQGTLIGVVTRSSEEGAAGLQVAALWNEMVLSRAGASGLLRGTVDTTTGDGFFALCGLPTGSEYQLRTGDDSLGTELLTVSSSEERVRRRDLRVGGRAPVVRLRGRVVSETGTPLDGWVAPTSDTSVARRAGASGQFEFVLPARSGQLWVRAVGYVQQLVDYDPPTGELDVGDVRLERVGREIAGRLIEGRVVSREEYAFEERRRTGVGTHLDSAFLARFPRVTSGVLAGNSRYARIGRGTGDVVLLRRGVSTCFPRIYVDGVYYGAQGANPGAGRPPLIPADLMSTLLREAKRIEIYPATYAPAQYPDFDGCGVVLLWTK